VVLSSVLVPLCLYPLLLWIMLTLLGVGAGIRERTLPTVALLPVPAEHAPLRSHLSGGVPGLRILEPAEIATGLGHAVRPQELVDNGTADAVVEIRPVPREGTPLRTDFTAEIHYRASSVAGREARQRLEQRMDSYRAGWLERTRLELGISDTEWSRFTITLLNVAPPEDITGFVLGLAVPLFLVVMVAFGCFYPAVDAVAGERERGTWETLLATGVDRRAVPLAKYLYVATMGGLAGVLNLVGVILTAGPLMTRLLGDEQGVQVSLGLPAAAILTVGLACLALVLAAAMLWGVARARTYREGQALATPVYGLVIVPAFFLQSPAMRLTGVTAPIPLVGLLLWFRQILSGQWSLALGAVVLLVNGTVAVAGLILVMRRMRLATLDPGTGSREANA
jgi:sodium transport system permease protein